MTNPPSRLEALRRRLPRLSVGCDQAEFASFAVDASGLSGRPPLALLQPASAGDIAPIVAAAREAGLRLVPVSSTGEHHRGDTLCAAETAILDLSRLRCVRRVDRRNRVALFEAGVDFPTLTRALGAEGLRPLLPLAPRPGKSALAAYLEREPTIYPRFQWDLSDPLLCTEVVWGTGELFRTGSAAGPGSVEEQWAAGDAQKNPMGPGQSDLMRVVQGAQGTLGVVTWCSARCEPLPSAERLYVSSSATLAPLVRAAYALLRRGHADILFLVDARALASLLAADRDACVRLAADLPRWHLVYSVAAPRWLPREKLAWVGREIDDLHRRLGIGARDAVDAAGRDGLHRRLTRPHAIDPSPWWKKARRNGTRELFFLSTLDRVERFLPLLDTLPAGTEHMAYVQPLLGGRNCHVEFVFPHDATPVAHAETNRLTLALAAEVRARGGFFSRPYGPYTDIAFAGSSTAWLLPRVKEIFDPDRLLSPGHLSPTPAPGEANA